MSGSSSNSLKRKHSSEDVEMDMGAPTDDAHDRNSAQLHSSTASFLHPDPRPNDIAHAGLRRGMALALDHVGFSAADPVAIESFALAVEEYLQSFIEALKLRSYSARREQPNPVDFEATLSRFNLTVDSLKPHLSPPISRDLLVPETHEISLAGGGFLSPLPTLTDDLSGRSEKEEKGYIPSQFPEFPSRHTFVSTPRDDNQTRRDVKRANEDVSKAAKQGEDALRGLLRASKIRQQKEVRSQVQSHDASRERYRLWELAMEKMMKAQGQDGGAPEADMAMADKIADASMIVNSSTQFMRRESARAVRGAGHAPRGPVGTESRTQ
ncbi:uncharacterized protein DNG_09830 [Cephalotrichum gorgonifer]|uniref:Transcription initiation factor TFIID subunit 8 n=1 Tax=Cephalotrichum gorgonifer TaxID=2041049 RepID=A0AAE8N6F3_9PEZI|nr:uncharacterized protein DNG_09830 [Cephalotrichum gorgonifer]